uniref:CYP4CU1 protein n=1 Tax=Ummeliata insecticeps TaxID=447592 RepID=D5H3H5_9ARAC|nr:CYP4CU1 protein [Ummeliata insecticeps]
MVLVQVLCAIAVAIFAYAVHWYMKIKSRMHHWKKLPSKSPSFLFGNLRQVIKVYTRKNKYHWGVYILERMMGQGLLYQKEGLYAFWVGPTPVIPVSCPVLMEKVLGSSVSIEKSFEYDFFHKWLGLGLLTSTGTKWRNRRKLLTPCFHFRILEDFLPAFDDQSRILVPKIEQRRGDDHVHVMPLVTLCTLDIVCETVMGYRIGAQTGQNLDYTTAIQNLGDFFNQRTIRPWLFSDFLFDLSQIGRGFNKDLRTIHSFTRNVIKQKKDAFKRQESEQSFPESVKEANEDGRRRRQALMDLLLNMFFNGGQLTEEDIQEEVETFMFAGHETTAAGVTYALYCIGLYQDIQERLHEELEAIFQGDVARAVTMDDVREMKYMECVLKESQRIYPSVPMVGRKTAEDIEHNGFTIPSGSEVHLNFMCLHRHPDSFPNPEVFDPDRFLPENVLKRHPYAYVPFSAGPRNCIGQKFALLEMKVIVANILRKFCVVSLDPRDKVFVKVEFTLKPAEPMRLKFLPRTPVCC